MVETFSRAALSLIPFEELMKQIRIAILELFGLYITLGTVKGMSLRISSIPSSLLPYGNCSLTERVSFTMGDFGFWFKITLSSTCLVGSVD